MLSYISLAIGAILVSNVILVQFLGICPFLGVSKKKSQAFGMGIAVICVVFLSSIITYGVYKLVLVPLDITYMDNVIFILIIASLVQFAELLIKCVKSLNWFLLNALDEIYNCQRILNLKNKFI